jgi:hypothetical protein
MKKASLACALSISLALHAFADGAPQLPGPFTLDQASASWRQAIEKEGVSPSVAAAWVDVAKKNIKAKADMKPIYVSGSSLIIGDKDDLARGDYLAIGMNSIPREETMARGAKAPDAKVLYVAAYAKGSLARVDLSGGKVIAFDSPGSLGFVLSVVDGKRNREYVAVYKGGKYDGYELRLRNFDLVFPYDKQGNWSKSMTDALPYYATGGLADKKEQRKYSYKRVAGGFELDSADGADRAFFTDAGSAIVEPGPSDPTKSMQRSTEEERRVPIAYAFAKLNDPGGTRVVVVETTRIVRTVTLDSSGGLVEAAIFSSPLGVVQKLVTRRTDRPWISLSGAEAAKYGEGATKRRYATSERTDYYSEDQVTSSITVFGGGTVARRLPGAESAAESPLPDWVSTEIYKIADGKVVVDPISRERVPAQLRYDCGSYTYILKGEEADGIAWNEKTGGWSLRNGVRTFVTDALLGSPSQYGLVPEERRYESQVDTVKDGMIVDSWVNWGVPNAEGKLLITGTKRYSSDGADPAGPSALIDSKGRWLNGTVVTTYPLRRLTVTMRGIANLDYDAAHPGKSGKGCPLVKGRVTSVQAGEEKSVVEKGATVVRREDRTQVDTYDGGALVKSSTTIDEFVDGAKVSSRAIDASP